MRSLRVSIREDFCFFRSWHIASICMTARKMMSSISFSENNFPFGQSLASSALLLVHR